MRYLISFLVIALLPACDHNPHTGPVLTVMTYNVGDYKLPAPTTAQVAEIIRMNGVPDLLLVQNMPWGIKIKDLARELKLPHFVSGRETNYRNNLGILSKLPLSNSDAIRFKLDTNLNSPASFLCAETQINLKTVVVCSLQLESLSPQIRKMEEDGDFFFGVLDILRKEIFQETARSRNAQKFLGWIKSKQYDEIIIGGDFNTFPLSKTIRIMNNRFDDALWPSLAYFTGTYTKVQFPVKPRIDFIFHSEGLNSTKAEIIQETAGDHYPVRADLGM